MRKNVKGKLIDEGLLETRFARITMPKKEWKLYDKYKVWGTRNHGYFMGEGLRRYEFLQGKDAKEILIEEQMRKGYISCYCRLAKYKRDGKSKMFANEFILDRTLGENTYPCNLYKLIPKGKEKGLHKFEIEYEIEGSDVVVKTVKFGKFIDNVLLEIVEKNGWLNHEDN